MIIDHLLVINHRSASITVREVKWDAPQYDVTGYSGVTSCLATTENDNIPKMATVVSS